MTIRYEYIDDRTTAVYLDGKRVGEICKMTDGFQYWPKGSRMEGGEIFPTLRECKQSLEAQ